MEERGIKLDDTEKEFAGVVDNLQRGTKCSAEKILIFSFLIYLKFELSRQFFIDLTSLDAAR